jgi:hypothetical protein
MSKRVHVELTLKSTNIDDSLDTTEATAVYGEMSFDSFQRVEDALIDALRGLRPKAE